MELRIVLFVVLIMSFILGLVAEQKITKRLSSLTLKQIKLPRIGHSSNLNFKSMEVDGMHNSVNAVSNMGLLIRKTKSSIQLGDISAQISKSLANTKREVGVCFNEIAKAKDPYEKLQNTIDVVFRHRRAFFIGTLGVCGLYAFSRRLPEE